MPVIALMLLLGAPIQESKPVALSFKPVAGHHYRFRVTHEMGWSFMEPGVGKVTQKHRSQFDAVLEFNRLKSKQWAMHGRVENAKWKGFDSSPSEDRYVLARFNKTIFSGRYDQNGRLVGYFDERVSGADIGGPVGFLGSIAGATFMDLRYPPRPVRQGSTWRIGLPAEQFEPSGEMIQTMSGQMVYFDFRVKRIWKERNRTLVEIVKDVDSVIRKSTPVGEDSVSVKQRATLILDVADGLPERIRSEVQQGRGPAAATVVERMQK